MLFPPSRREKTKGEEIFHQPPILPFRFPLTLHILGLQLGLEVLYLLVGQLAVQVRQQRVRDTLTSSRGGETTISASQLPRRVRP